MTKSSPTKYSVQLGDAIVNVDAQEVLTVLPSGAIVSGCPHDTEAYRQTAMNNGYAGDVARMNRCHDVGHSLLAHWLGLPVSPMMQRVAHGDTQSNELTTLEEDALQAIERFANAMNIDLEQIARSA